MKLFITGAGGFLGQHVAAEALQRGHSVRALLRPASKSIPETWKNHPAIEIVRSDLRNKSGLREIISGCDSVIHLAAVKSGDLYEQFGGTVISTENLLATMEGVGISRLVLISSFSVYEYMRRRSWSTIDESSPLARDPLKRDEYCQTKMIQEKISLECAERNNWRCMVLRPGVIYGRENLWTARLGSQSGTKRWISIGSHAPLPLTYVENCAAAILLAAEYNGSEKIHILNVVDGKNPSQRSYISFLKKHMSENPRVIPIPWLLMRFLACMAGLFNSLFLRGKGKLPGLLIPERLHARCKPLRYSNRRIVLTLGWAPRYTWKEGVLRSLDEAEVTMETASKTESLQ